MQLFDVGCAIGNTTLVELRSVNPKVVILPGRGERCRSAIFFGSLCGGGPS